ncbi:hypothetical protein K3495_g15280 [Podosphaera aphanis]|nr:hypothetical protein K3495_g15280 [Podosphaera aphanis]
MMVYRFSANDQQALQHQKNQDREEYASQRLLTS